MAKSIDRQKTKQALDAEILKVRQHSRLLDSDGDIDDMGACEYIEELNSVVEVIVIGLSDAEILDAAANVGADSYIVYSGEGSAFEDDQDGDLKLKKHKKTGIKSQYRKSKGSEELDNFRCPVCDGMESEGIYISYYRKHNHNSYMIGNGETTMAVCLGCADEFFSNSNVTLKTWREKQGSGS